jgi:hypothetical protein
VFKAIQCPSSFICGFPNNLKKKAQKRLEGMLMVSGKYLEQHFFGQFTRIATPVT